MPERQLPRSLWILYAGTVLTRLGTFVVPYLTIFLSDARSLSFAATGRIISAGSLGLLFGNLAGGWLADRWSRKGALLVALATNAAGFAALGTVEGTGWVYAGLLFFALAGAGMYTPAANAIIADETSDSARQFAYTVNYVCINVGMGLGPLLGGLLAAVAYRWLFVGDVVTSILCFALVAVGMRLRTPTIGRPVPGSSVAVWLRHRSVLAFCLAGFFVIAPLMGLEYAVPILVKTELGAPLALVGVVYTINASCILILSFPLERLIRGRNEALMMALAGALWTAGLAILAVGFSVAALLACTVVWTLGEIIASIVVPTYVSKRVAPAAKGRMLAANDAVRSVAGIVSPIALGMVWDGSGVVAVLYVLLALPVVGTVVYLAAATARSRRASPAPAPAVL